MGSVALGTYSGRVSPQQLPLLSKATSGSSSFARQMVPMGLGYIETAAPGEVGRVFLGLRWELGLVGAEPGTLGE